MSDIIQIITTINDRERAREIGDYLVKERLAACSQIIGPIHSTYHWMGRIEESEEYYCVMKTKSSLYHRAEEAIRSLHPYEVPEIIAVPIQNSFSGYAAWIFKETI